MNPLRSARLLVVIGILVAMIGRVASSAKTAAATVGDHGSGIIRRRGLCERRVGCFFTAFPAGGRSFGSSAAAAAAATSGLVRRTSRGAANGALRSRRVPPWTALSAYSSGGSSEDDDDDDDDDDEGGGAAAAEAAVSALVSEMETILSDYKQQSGAGAGPGEAQTALADLHGRLQAMANTAAAVTARGGGGGHGGSHGGGGGDAVGHHEIFAMTVPKLRACRSRSSRRLPVKAATAADGSTTAQSCLREKPACQSLVAVQKKLLKALPQPQCSHRIMSTPQLAGGCSR